MADVKNLFLGGLMVRRVSAAVMLLCLFVLWVTKANWKKDSGKRISDRSWDRHSRSRVSGRSADCRF